MKAADVLERTPQMAMNEDIKFDPSAGKEAELTQACSSPLRVDQPMRACPVAPRCDTVTSKYQVPSLAPCVARACGTFHFSPFESVSVSSCPSNFEEM